MTKQFKEVQEKAENRLNEELEKFNNLDKRLLEIRQQIEQTIKEKENSIDSLDVEKTVELNTKLLSLREVEKQIEETVKKKSLRPLLKIEEQRQLIKELHSAAKKVSDQINEAAIKPFNDLLALSKKSFELVREFEAIANRLSIRPDGYNIGFKEHTYNEFDLKEFYAFLGKSIFIEYFERISKETKKATTTVTPTKPKA